MPTSQTKDIGAILVSSALPFTVPSGTAIYAISPNPSWDGKAVAAEGWSHLTSDRTSAGAVVPGILSEVAGCYTSITVTSGSCFVYIKREGLFQ